MQAAEAARKASSVTDSSRVIEVLVTEDGIVVRGSSIAPGRPEIKSSGEVSWRDFMRRPRLLVDSVHLIDGAIKAKEDGPNKPRLGSS